MAWSRRVGIEGNRKVKCFLAGSNSNNVSWFPWRFCKSNELVDINYSKLQNSFKFLTILFFGAHLKPYAQSWSLRPPRDQGIDTMSHIPPAFYEGSYPKVYSIASYSFQETPSCIIVIVLKTTPVISFNINNSLNDCSRDFSWIGQTSLTIQ